MNEIPESLWIEACAHCLQRRWRTVDPLQLEEMAGLLWQDVSYKQLTPAEAADAWLKPVTLSTNEPSLHHVA